MKLSYIKTYVNCNKSDIKLLKNALDQILKVEFKNFLKVSSLKCFFVIQIAIYHVSLKSGLAGRRGNSFPCF